MSKINEILTEWKEGDVHSLSWLRERGVGQRLAYKYSDELGSLERIGPGIYKRVGEKIKWMGVIQMLQQEQKMNVHLSSKTSLELHGHSHSLAFGRARIYLRSYNKKALPKWLEKLPAEWDLIYKKSKMFSGELKLTKVDLDNFSLNVSPRELAILELIDDSNLENSLETIENYMSGLFTLRESFLQFYLETCNSIKVKRVFLYLAEKLNLPCIKNLKFKKIDLGKGKRVVVKGGKFNNKYNITVDRENLENFF